MITFMPAATSAALCALLVGAVPALAQEAETGPRRAPAGIVAPESAGPNGDASAVRPVGAAPVPEELGPLGEPAPAALIDSAGPVLEVPDSGLVSGVASEAPLGESEPVEATPVEAVPTDAPLAEPEPAEAPAVEAVPSAAPLGEPAALEPTPVEAVAPTLISAEPDGPLGEPVPRPTRRSFMPIARASLGQAPVSAIGSAWGLTGAAFLEEQLTHRRVVDAQLDAKFDLKAFFAERGLSYPPRDLYFRLFKQEQVLEVWVRATPEAESYTLLREYPICAIPGRLGPKTRVDDFQAPEGFYFIQGFNPESEFHLSLRLNYPNAADRIIGVTDAPGGDIYIHGGCSTVGCFPMTDEAMAELYWLAVEARTAGQSIIPVHVFPARMHDANMRWLSTTFSRDRQLVAFWENLREGYQYFEDNRRVPSISVDGRGRYVFAEPGTEPEGGPLGAELTLPIRVEAPAPEEGLVRPEPEVATPEEGLLAPEPEVATPEEGLVAPEPEVATPEEGLVAPEPQAAATPEEGPVSAAAEVATPEIAVEEESGLLGSEVEAPPASAAVPSSAADSTHAALPSPVELEPQPAEEAPARSDPTLVAEEPQPAEEVPAPSLAPSMEEPQSADEAPAPVEETATPLP